MYEYEAELPPVLGGIPNGVSILEEGILRSWKLEDDLRIGLETKGS